MQITRLGLVIDIAVYLQNSRRDNQTQVTECFQVLSESNGKIILTMNDEDLP